MGTFPYIWTHTHKKLCVTQSCMVIKQIGQARGVLLKSLAGINI